MGQLDGRIALVTGASSGIGEATALALAAEGAAVAIAARRTDRLAELQARLEKEDGRVISLELDVTDETACRRAVQRTQDELGGLDILINNAGVMLLGPIDGAPTDEWRRMIDANLYGVLYCTHAVLPIMLAQDGDPRGHIVNVSSVAGRRATAGSGVYNLTKFGVNAFSEALRQELAESDIRVTIIEPGAVSTELVSHNRDEIKDAMKGRMAGVTPMQPTDIANAIIYALAQPSYVSINEVLVRPTRQVR
jgi:NADP-dependent 3-hydroxy acid dehydrogenase YdfG